MLFRLPEAIAVVGALASVVNGQASQAPVYITGASVPSGSSVPLRKNINDLQSAGGPAWDLYIRSLVAMYAKSSDDQLGFFQIAGIHGRPYTEWNGAGQRESTDWGGYCPHGENIFLTWHRPYLALFEQQLVATAKTLANQYTGSNKAKYVAAAATLRAPYWDWALNTNVPAATAPTTLTVTGPNGKITVENPLRYYHFPQKALAGTYDKDFSKNSQIYKCRAPSSYPAGANANMAKRSYRQWTYDALTSSTTFAQFASTSSTGVSLEQIHNAVHWDGSCAQQFLDADYSGFDPLFMLHHAQVDRIWALWQAMKPKQSTFSGSYSGGARFQVKAGTQINLDSKLFPFRKDSKTFYTSNLVNNHLNFGYTYESLESTKTAAQRQKDATALVNRLYGSGGVVSRKAKRDGDSGKLTRYFVNVGIDVEQLGTNRPCAIGVYANTTSVGNFIIMKQPVNGTQYAKLGFEKVIDPEEVRDEKTMSVVDEIKSSLRIEIKTVDGVIVPLSTVPSLNITIESVDVVPPVSDTALPVYTDAETHTAPKKQLGSPGSAGSNQPSSGSSSSSESSYESSSKSSYSSSSGSSSGSSSDSYSIS